MNGAPDRADGIIAAADRLLLPLSRGEPIDTRALRFAMEASFGGSDAQGLWCWKDAYEAGEVALLLFLASVRTCHSSQVAVEQADDAQQA